jgi:Baseplate J-like protein
MQITDQEEKQRQMTPVGLPSQPLEADPDHNGTPLLSVAEADAILSKAAAEIERQLLATRKRTASTTLADGLEILWLVAVLCGGLVGMTWLCLTYPHTLVILYAKTTPATITVTLGLATRPLAPVTVTRSQTAPTTGTGHQDATQARGNLTFYNGSFTPTTIEAGTIFPASDGIQVVTTETITIPPGNPPTYGEATVPAHAMQAGGKGNLNAGVLHTTVSSDVLVKNSQFTGGSDARNFQAVAPVDLDRLRRTTTQLVNQTIQHAFIFRPGETVQETSCTMQTTANHTSGEEASQVTVNVSATCQGVAYRQDVFQHQATVAFTQTRPAAHYHTIGSVQTTIQSTSPFVVTIRGQWVYTFSADYEQSLAEKIVGATPTQARTVLLQTGVIADASIPGKLPPDGYIDFLVLVG